MEQVPLDGVLAEAPHPDGGMGHEQVTDDDRERYETYDRCVVCATYLKFIGGSILYRCGVCQIEQPTPNHGTQPIDWCEWEFNK
jgi:hypothetical protein